MVKKLFKFFMFINVGVLFAASPHNPYEVIYDAYMSGTTLDKKVSGRIADELTEPVKSTSDYQRLQNLQKSFIPKVSSDSIALVKFKECSYSDQSISERSSLRDHVNGKITQERKKLKADDVVDNAKDAKMKAFESLLKIDAFQDENWQEVGYHDNFYALLCSTIKELSVDSVIKVLQEWKSVIWQEERKETIKHKFILALQPVWHQTVLQRLQPLKDVVSTFVLYVFAMSLIKQTPIEFAGNSNTTLMPYVNGSSFLAIEGMQGLSNITLSQVMSPNYAPSYFIATMVFMVTAVYFLNPLIHQLDYGFTRLVEKYYSWKQIDKRSQWQKINTEELTDNMINTVFDQTKNFDAQDFNAVVDGISGILLDLVKSRVFYLHWDKKVMCTINGYNIPIFYPFLTNSDFNKDFEKKVQAIIEQVKKTVVLK